MRSERGLALVTAMLVTLLMMAIIVATLLAASTEALISSGFRQSREALYAADAIAGRAMADLAQAPDWNQVLAGSVRSGFVDGSATGTRTLGDGSTIDLAQIVNLANCRQTTACTASEMNQPTAERPWAANNPHWRLFAHGFLRDMLGPGRIESPFYVTLLVADDPGEADGDPLTDGTEGAPGAGVLALRAEAHGPRGGRKQIELTIGRSSNGRGSTQPRVVSWREVR